jgi:hypothetical protein
MGGNYFIPRGDAEFDAFFKHYVQVVNQNTAGSSPVWTHIPAARVTELTNAYADWYNHAGP